MRFQSVLKNIFCRLLVGLPFFIILHHINILNTQFRSLCYLMPYYSYSKLISSKREKKEVKEKIC